MLFVSFLNCLIMPEGFRRSLNFWVLKAVGTRVLSGERTNEICLVLRPVDNIWIRIICSLKSIIAFNKNNLEDHANNYFCTLSIIKEFKLDWYFSCIWNTQCPPNGPRDIECQGHHYEREVTNGGVVRAGISVTWNVLSWAGGHEFEPWLGRTWVHSTSILRRTWTKRISLESLSKLRLSTTNEPSMPPRKRVSSHWAMGPDYMCTLWIQNQDIPKRRNDIGPLGVD